MSNWINEEIKDVQELINNYKTQTKIISKVDNSLTRMEATFDDLGVTLEEYQSRMYDVIELRKTLVRINSKMSDIKQNSIDTKGNIAQWTTEGKTGDSEDYNSQAKRTPVKDLGYTPTLSYPYQPKNYDFDK